MMGNINFGIDLGAINSGIAFYVEGRVSVLKNPFGFRETMPSVVAYKAERILIGDEANEQLLSNPERLFSSFKRRMGKAESYRLEGRDIETNPVDLSALVLKELFNFSLHHNVISAVITIPVSFDTIQSNPTKKSRISGRVERGCIIARANCGLCGLFESERYKINSR